MSNFSSSTDELIKQYRVYLDECGLDDGAVNIQVDEIAARVASFYEKIRGLIDYQESHLLRKSLIERALQRRIFLKDISGEDIAEPLIKEVIRSGHLGNNLVPEAKIGETQTVIDATLSLLDYFDKKSFSDKDGMVEWLICLTVVAVEEILAPSDKEMMLSDAVFKILNDGLEVRGVKISDEDRQILIFIAIQKSLFKVDDSRLHYRLLNFLYPSWEGLKINGGETQKMGDDLIVARWTIKRYLKHSWLPFFMKACNRERAVFYTLGDLIFKSKDLSKFDDSVREVYQERYDREKGRLFKVAFLTVISFFLSKILVALAIEVPIDVYVVHHFSLLHTLANVIFPPILMFLIVVSIRMPSENNLNLVTEETRRVVFGPVNKKYSIVVPKRKNVTAAWVVRLVYAFLFFVTLYYFALLLLKLGFSVTNIIVFVFFTSLVTATGVKVSNRARELSLERERPRFLSFILDLITLPLVTMGRWVITGLKHFNALVIFFNLLIELPFQLFVEFLENFNSFMKAKKEEVE